MAQNLAEAVSKDEPCLITETDFFSTVPLTAQIEREFYQTIMPLTPISDSNPSIIFQVDPSTFFLDFSNFLIKTTFKISLENGDDLRK